MADTEWTEQEHIVAESAQIAQRTRYVAGDIVDGRYRIEAVLGQGGFAEAYKACDTTSAKLVVLKIPQLAMMGDIAAYNRYRREIEIGQRLAHPGLQRLYQDDGATARTASYMILEYVEGESLRSYIGVHAPVPIDEVLNIAAQLTNTLQYVHDQGVVHRDLKPDNILIASTGQVKVADFGIALRLGSRRLTFNHLSHAVGTPDYMAPEQVRGERGDTRTDIYALGVVLFELLTGRVPYPTDDALTKMARTVQSDPPLVRRLRADIPPQLEAVVYRALRRRPEERYQSMAELGDDLRHLEDVSLPTYVPDVPPPAALGDLPPWRLWVPVLVAIFAVLLVAGVLAQLAHGVAPR